MNTENRYPEKDYVFKYTDTPVGRLKLVASGHGLAAILWENDSPRRVPLNIVGEAADHPILIEVERQLREYFAGSRRVFDIELDLGGTSFQHDVWRALLTIPYGEIRSYGDIARQIGRPKAVRAVGAANGRNLISIVAPCHRVVGSAGALTGSAGGLKAKAYLLGLENPRSGLFGDAG